MAYVTKIYREEGGDKMVVASGGEIELRSGATLDVQDGASVNLDLTTGLDSITLGTQADTAGSGITLTSSKTGILQVYADDNDASIAADVRAVRARTLLDATQAGGTIRSLQGQLKLVDGVGLGTGVYTATQGYVELMGDHTIASAGKCSCFDASLEIASGKTLTVASGAYAAGLKVETTGAGSISNSGTCAAILVENASGAPAWPVGLAIGTSMATTGITIGTVTSLGIDVGTAATGISFTGTYTGNAIDFSNATIDPTGSNGPCMIRCGTYASPLDYGADDHQSGLIRLYTTCSGASSYDRGVFVCTKTTGAKGAFPVAGLAEANNTGTGPAALQAAQFIAHLGADGSASHLATLGGSSTAGMYGAWLKVCAGTGGCVCDSGSRVAAAWIDNQMNGTVSGEEYGIFSTTGCSRPGAWAGFETTSSGYSQLLYFDETFNSGAGTCVTTDAVPGTQDARILVYYNGTQYYLPLYR